MRAKRYITVQAKRNKVKRTNERKQVTRGHNIIADGWAGTCNSHPHPRPHHTQTITTAALKMQLGQLDQHRPMDGQTDGLTDVWTKPLIEVRVRT